MIYKYNELSIYRKEAFKQSILFTKNSQKEKTDKCLLKSIRRKHSSQKVLTSTL